MNLYHYYERSKEPLLNLSDLPIQNAEQILNSVELSNTFAARRPVGYLERRKELEQTVRDIFISKGGKPIRKVPHYFVVEPCLWLKTWYLDASHIKLSMSSLLLTDVSFTYGDMFPTFSPVVQDDKEYRNNVYTYEEILILIDKYGLPQHWNPDGKLGPERYIEAQVWCDLTPDDYIAE